MGYKTKLTVSGLVLTFISLFVFVYSVYAEENQGENRLVAEEMITSGARLENWQWVTSSGKVNINLIEVDLYNPFIKLDTIVGKEGQTGNKQRISDMAKEANAVAAINGDFFTLNAEGAPFGIQIQNGNLISSPGYIYPKNAFLLNEDKVPFINQMEFSGTIKTKDGSSFRLFGINKTQYLAGYRFSGNSHQNRLHMYTDVWNMNNWVGKNLDSYTVVLVENGVATKKLANQTVNSIPENSYLLLGHGVASEFLQKHVNIGELVEADFSILPSGEWSLALDGSTLLVVEGKSATILSEVVGNLARTAIGYSKDKRYVYLVTVEKSSKSVGMTLSELTDFLLYRGVYKAVNLDGGGSTTMVARPLGTTSLTDVTLPSLGVEREVPNGLAIFSTVPKGKLLGFSLSLPKGAFLGEKIPTLIVGAYDQYYNPIDLDILTVDWSSTNDGVSIDDQGYLTFNKSGIFQLKAKIGNVENSYSIEVYDQKDIKEIRITEERLRLHSNESIKPTVIITLQDGTSMVISNSLLGWRLIGAKGSIDKEGKLTAIEQSEGLLIASYQGFSTSVPLSIGSSEETRIIDSFSNQGHYLISALAGSEVGSFKVIQADAKENSSNQANLVLNYDFGNFDGLRIVYLNYGTVGKQVAGEPAELRLKVNGDNSGHWLRAEVRDVKGKVYYLDLAKQIDWIGWKELIVPIPPNIIYPITIKSIYVVHLENSKDSTRTDGQLTFAQLEVKDWSSPKDIEREYLRLTLNEKEAFVGSSKIVLDQAPIVIAGKTYLPIRHIAELLGGTVNWIAAEQKIEIIRSEKIYSFWINQGYMNSNGIKQGIATQPFISNGRTLLPLRVISESLGLYIEYDSKTKGITIH